MRLWVPGEPCPPDVAEHICSGGTVTAHNAAFERVIWHHIFTPRHGWPEPALEQWRCTMAQALALSLPGGLDNLAGALGVAGKKDAAGYRKMMQMSKPRNILDDGTVIWWDDAERLAGLYAYCAQDVVVEREVGKRLLELRPFEQRLWQLDQRINDRGVHVDSDLCAASNGIAGAMQSRLDKAMRTATDGAVTGCMNANQLRDWLILRGVETDSVDKESVAALLSSVIPDDVQKALELRQQGSRTSTAKADALLRGMNADGRARGMLQYHAANTGRWGGRRFQPQNLKRPDENTDTDAAIAQIKSGNPDLMLMLHDDPVSVLGDCLRGLVDVEPGNVMRAGDFSNIEGRVLAWLAGEQWKLDAFAAYDRGEGEDLYKVTAGAILDKPAAEVTKPERQSVGKVSELALGYQGGVGAMATMSGGRVDFALLYDMLAAKMPDHAARAETSFKERGAGYEARWWQAAEIIKLAWRERHPGIKSLWRSAGDAAMDAVRQPGSVQTVGKMAFRKAGSFLFMQLPSGRCLSYPYPRIERKKTPWLDDDEEPIYQDTVTFMGEAPQSRAWVRQTTYGGKLVENATQAVARDLLAHAMVTLDAAGWPIVLHVHDEIVCETPADFGSTEELERLMSSMPAWANGCPVSTEGWSGERYRK